MSVNKSLDISGVAVESAQDKKKKRANVVEKKKKKTRQKSEWINLNLWTWWHFPYGQKELPKIESLMLKEKYKRKAPVAMTEYPKDVKVHLHTHLQYKVIV